MSEYDLVIRNGTVATAADTVECDVGIKDGVVATLGRGLGPGTREIDAAGKLVLPGGIDSHCHIEQRSSAGVVCADDFYSATVAAAFGGTTTVIPFAAQHRGQSLRQVVQEYHEAARPKAVIDYAFHLIITDPTEQVMGQELPALIRDGYTSFKVYMTYDLLQLDDHQMLDILALARREGALVMVHAEKYDMIRWLTDRLLERGLGAPRYHAISHARLAEGEATNRAVESGPIARRADPAGSRFGRGGDRRDPQCPDQGPQDLRRDLPAISVSDRRRHRQARASKAPNSAAARRRATTRRSRRYGPGSPPASFRSFRPTTRPTASPARARCRYGEEGALQGGREWRAWHRGAVSAAVFGRGRAGPHRAQRVCGIDRGHHAKLYGLYPRKGTIAVGSDADIAIWDPDREVTMTAGMLHDNVGYTPYEGRQLRGWPVIVLSRGRVVVEDGKLAAARGQCRHQGKLDLGDLVRRVYGGAVRGRVVVDHQGGRRHRRRALLLRARECDRRAFGQYRPGADGDRSVHERAASGTRAADRPSR